MRAFVALRKLPPLVRKDDLLKVKREVIDYIDEILADQNDINESTRAQLDAISTALAELQVKRPANKPRRPIGFVQREEDDT